MAEESIYIIGIAGGSASGKTTVIEELKKYFKNSELTVISQDHYYRGLSEQVIDQNGEINFDRPEGIDFTRLVKDIKKLRKGEDVHLVEYTFNNPKKFPKPIVFKPARVVVIEGLFIYQHKALQKFMDLKVFIDARLDVMLERRLRRDSKERGMTRKQIIYQWENHVMPAYEEFLLPHRDDVDLILVNNTHFKNSFQVLCDHIQAKLHA
jgi:uridine kinase